MIFQKKKMQFQRCDYEYLIRLLIGNNFTVKSMGGELSFCYYGAASGSVALAVVTSYIRCHTIGFLSQFYTLDLLTVEYSFSITFALFVKADNVTISFLFTIAGVTWEFTVPDSETSS